MDARPSHYLAGVAGRHPESIPLAPDSRVAVRGVRKMYRTSMYVHKVKATDNADMNAATEPPTCEHGINTVGVVRTHIARDGAPHKITKVRAALSCVAYVAMCSTVSVRICTPGMYERADQLTAGWRPVALHSFQRSPTEACVYSPPPTREWMSMEARGRTPT